MHAAWVAGQTFDAVTVSEALEAIGKLEFVGGLAYIGALQNAVPSSANAARYALIVRERAKLRGLAAVGAEVSELGFKADIGADEAIAEAQARIAELAERGTTTGFLPFADALATAADRSTDPTRRALQGLMPNADLERIMGGCEPGSLIIVAARPSVGKSVFGQQATTVAGRRGYASAFSAARCRQSSWRCGRWRRTRMSRCRNPRRQGQHEIRADQRCHVQAGRAANQG